MRNASFVAICVLAMAACSGKAVNNAGCTSNSDCSGGEVCDAGDCVILCVSDLDCVEGEVCEDSLCVEGVRDNPTIDNVDGDGTMVCPDAGGSHCISAGILVVGTNLDGAQFNLQPQAGGTAVALFSRPESSDTQAAVDLPLDVAPGTYVLTAANQVGSADQALELLQGPPGPDLTANEMVTRINSASNVISLSVLPVGDTAGDVASGAHGHDAAAITSGVIDAARLPSLDFLPLTGGDVDALTVAGTDVCLADGTNCARGVLYTRWGRNDCPGTATLVYAGMAGGTNHSHGGGGAGTLCLSTSPTWFGNENDGNQNGGLIYGMEYQTSGYGLPAEFTSLHDREVPCAVCLADANVKLSLPGETTCPEDWNQEYNGYLMSTYYNGQSASEWLCVDRAPIAYDGASTNNDQALIYPVEYECGSLRCAPYVQDREATCAICTR